MGDSRGQPIAFAAAFCPLPSKSNYFEIETANQKMTVVAAVRKKTFVAGRAKIAVAVRAKIAVAVLQGKIDFDID